MTPTEFAVKWRASKRNERAASQEHFIDLCHMLGRPTPNDDPTGDVSAFEKGAEKLNGDDGWADVWYKDRFGWEYKGKRADLKAAYRQLNDYREDLGNPPLLVVSDLHRFEVHTNFTGTVKQLHEFTLDDLEMAPAEPLRVLRALFDDPDALKPSVTRQELTEEAAREFAAVAIQLRDRGHEPQLVAHFLDRLLFCMFAEDVGLLPRGLMERLTDATHTDPGGFARLLGEIFEHMSTKGGGFFGTEKVQWFNGSLFDSADVIALTNPEIETVGRAAKLDWADVEPAIFGTLFERGLDPDRRSQLGAHYTDRDSIVRLVEPVLMAPLRKEWSEAQARIEQLIAEGYGPTSRRRPQPSSDPQKVFEAFLDRLRSITVLDSACGSGNFLYVALQELKEFEREVIVWASGHLGVAAYPQVGPHQLHGIEINPYAAELARVTIWIGQLQWQLANGYGYEKDPVLKPLDNIETRDALIDWSDPEEPVEATWPNADVVIGNPPFLGDKLLRGGLGSNYVDTLTALFRGRLPAQSDLACYWHEKARAMVEAGHVKRVGLLATQGIRGGANRRVLERIKESGDIFVAWADENWVLDGANVHVSFVGFDDGTEHSRTLDGHGVLSINANLTAGIDLTHAPELDENAGIAFLGSQKAGPFDLTSEEAAAMLAGANPDGRDNADVVKRRANGASILRGPEHPWVIDFGPAMSREEAALYEAPFELVKERVRPTRASNPRKRYREEWWIHAEPRPGMRSALAGLSRYIATPTLAKHRVFVWLPLTVLPDHQVVVFARDDDYFFGVLHSRVHEAWARGMGTQLREVESGFRYTPTTTFDTFPFPRPSSEQSAAVLAAAKRLDELRNGRLNPSGASETQQQAKTLTQLYNENPTWLQLAHAQLDSAVLAAYGWPADISDDDLLASLLKLNLERSAES